MDVVVRLPLPPAMADDRGGFTNWTPPWQAIQRNYPGSKLSLASGSAMRKIKLA